MNATWRPSGANDGCPGEVRAVTSACACASRRRRSPTAPGRALRSGACRRACGCRATRRAGLRPARGAAGRSRAGPYRRDGRGRSPSPPSGPRGTRSSGRRATTRGRGHARARAACPPLRICDVPPVGLLDRERDALAVRRERRPGGAVRELRGQAPGPAPDGQHALHEGAGEVRLRDVGDAARTARRRGRRRPRRSARRRSASYEHCNCTDGAACAPRVATPPERA